MASAGVNGTDIAVNCTKTKNGAGIASAAMRVIAEKDSAVPLSDRLGRRAAGTR
jgi:hypothetical protein